MAEAEQTLFDKIVDGTIPSYKVWEDDAYLAFLTPFANTPGVTVVIPKKNPGAYVFALDDQVIAGLMVAVKKVAHALEKVFDVERVATVFEGEAVPHVHAKLYPMHHMSDDRSNFPQQEVFFSQYPGYITTVEGPMMSDEQLSQIQQKIKEAAS
jgi:diadenosine tetraphosphate (Ap4A) HIT family hydrolase